jgi:hypothetical protein
MQQTSLTLKVNGHVWTILHSAPGNCFTHGLEYFAVGSAPIGSKIKETVQVKHVVFKYNPSPMHAWPMAKGFTFELNDPDVFIDENNLLRLNVEG